MTLARPFATVLLFLPLATFAQDRQGPLYSGPAARSAISENKQSSPSEPWRIIPVPKPDLCETGNGKASVLFADKFKAPVSDLFPDAQLSTDATCYAIRSYVVARDDKDSDSTHFVSYSTCQPASRYRLKAALVQETASEH